MRKDFLLGVIVTIIAMALFYISGKKEKSNSEVIETTQKKSPVFVTSQGAKPLDNVPAERMNPNQPAPVVDPAQIEIIEKKFADQLTLMGQCLRMPNAVDHNRIEPTFDNLIVSLRPALGEMVVQLDDWMQKDFQTPDGALKRIRTEVEYQETGSPIKRVQLYNINDQGMPEMQTLDEDLATNPTDSYIDSLEGAAAKSVLSEQGGRIYYQEGEELIIVERNGKIESLTLTKGDKTVNCTGLDTVESSCQCLE